MKTLTLLLIIIAFLQSTILSLNLGLLILICRSYIKTEDKNLYLAFGFGLLISQLELLNFGLVSILYLIIVQLSQMFSKSPFAKHFILILPLTFILLSLNQIISSFFISQKPLFPKVIIESLLSLPIFYLIKLWEERFIVQKGIKLKI